MRTLLLLIPTLFFVGCNSDAPQTHSAAAATQPAKVEALSPPAQTPPPPAAVTPADNTTRTSLSGESLYKRKCASCHGLNAQKSALGKSQIIAAWPSERIAHAVNGYKTGTYGKSMKALMEAQVRDLSQEDIDILAHYISAQH